MDDQKTPVVNLGKETRRDIAGAIRELSRQFREQRDEKKSRSFADNIAHGIAGGASISDSIKDAAGVSAEKAKETFKKTIDPVQIVKRLTGSKLATVLAGKALGRNATKVRAIADIPQPMVPEQTEDTNSPTGIPETETSPTPYTAPTTSPGQLGSDQNQSVFADMLKFMGLINLQVHAIGTKLGANVGRNAKGQFNKMNAPQEKILADIRNQLILGHKEDKAYQQHDTDLEEEQAKLLRESDALQKRALEEAEKAQDLARGQGHPDQSPTQIPVHGMASSLFGKGEGHKDTGSGILGGLGSMAASALGVGGLVAGGAKIAKGALNAIKHPIKTMKSMAGTAGKFIAHPIETTKAAVSALKTFAGVGTKAAASALAPTAAKVAEKAVTKAPGVIAKVAGAAKGGKKAVGALVQKLMPSMMKKYGGKLTGSLIPGIGTLIGAGMTVGSLLKGDWIGAGLNAVGMIPYASLATIPTAIAREVYSEVYDGADPFTDPLRGERMPELLASVQQQVGDWISGKEKSPTQIAQADQQSAPGTSPSPAGPEAAVSPSGVLNPVAAANAGPPGTFPTPTKIGGDGLNALSREQAASMTNGGAGGGAGSPPVIMSNNPVTNINNQLVQKMGPTRNPDSSFLRRQYHSSFAT